MLIRSVYTLLMIFPVIALAQSGEEERVDRMERRLMAMENRVFSQNSGAMSQQGNSGAVSTLADFEIRLSQLEEETRRVYGGVEELSHSVSQLAKKLELISSDLNLRLQDLESGKAVKPAAAGAAGQPVSQNSTESATGNSESETPATQTVGSGLSAQQHYQTAYNYLSTASYDQAEEWFASFIEQYATDALAENAYYWLGEVHLVKNQPEKAVIAFSNGLKNFPEGERVATELLKMGSAFERLGRVDHARSSWEKLLRDFPSSSEADKARQLLSELKS